MSQANSQDSGPREHWHNNTRHKTWVVVADREHARFFLHAHAGASLEPVDSATINLEDAIPEYSDRPGRIKDSRGHTMYHAMEASTDIQALAQRKMADTILHSLEEKLKEAPASDQIFLVAAPATLGAIREHLRGPLRDRVVGDLDKNLSAATREELAQRLNEDGRLGKVI